KGQAVGLMITASHNPEQDNGLKIIDPSGEMLHHTWESIATNVVNMPQDEVLAYLQKKYEELSDKHAKPTIFVGRDTRPHSNRFSKLVIRACASIASPVIIKFFLIHLCMSVRVCVLDIIKRNAVLLCVFFFSPLPPRDFGEVTTPQMHYLVRYGNMQDLIETMKSELYVAAIGTTFLKCLKLLAHKPTKIKGELIVDCANGVGGIVLQQVCSLLDDYLAIHLIHLPSSNWKVNHQCGAEHVQKKHQLPQGLRELQHAGKQDNTTNWKKSRLASVDGDCDRLIYYFVDECDQLQILDGDKLMCLLFTCLKRFIHQTNASLT
ncbi:hypothetical protein RFI_36070, partial [Reticulomyxa filosa]